MTTLPFNALRDELLGIYTGHTIGFNTFNGQMKYIYRLNVCFFIDTECIFLPPRPSGPTPAEFEIGGSQVVFFLALGI